MPYQEYDNIQMTPDQYQKLVDRFGQSEANYRIETLSIQKHAKGYKYKSDYHAVLSWARRDGERPLKAVPRLHEPLLPAPDSDEADAFFDRRVTSIHKMFERDFANGLRSDVPSIERIRESLSHGSEEV